MKDITEVLPKASKNVKPTFILPTTKIAEESVNLQGGGLKFIILSNIFDV